MRKILGVAVIQTIIISLLILVIPFSFHERSYGHDVTGDMLPVGEITKDFIVEQRFESTINNFSSIHLFMATYARSNTTNLSLTLQKLVDGKWEHIHSQIINSSVLKDNMYYEFKVPEQEQAINQEFLLTLSTDNGISGDAVTAWATKGKADTGSTELLINGIVQDGYIPYYLDYSQNISIGSLMKLTEGIGSPTLEWIKYISVVGFIYMCFLLFNYLVAICLKKRTRSSI